MKLEQPQSIHTVTGAHIFPPDRIVAELGEDETLRELRELWPSTVELAKQRGLIYRLHTILNA